MTEAAFRGRKDIPAPTRSGDLLAHSDKDTSPFSIFGFDDRKKKCPRVSTGSPVDDGSQSCISLGLRPFPLVMATCRKTIIIALLRTPLSVIMGHGFPSRPHAGRKAVLIPHHHHRHGQCFQTTAAKMRPCSINVCLRWKGEGVTQCSKRKGGLGVAPPAFGVVEGSRSADPRGASLLPNSSPAKMTGCRQRDSFDWVRGPSQAQPLPWVRFGHVISERSLPRQSLTAKDLFCATLNTWMGFC